MDKVVYCFLEILDKICIANELNDIDYKLIQQGLNSIHGPLEIFSLEFVFNVEIYRHDYDSCVRAWSVYNSNRSPIFPFKFFKNYFLFVILLCLVYFSAGWPKDVDETLPI